MGGLRKASTMVRSSSSVFSKDLQELFAHAPFMDPRIPFGNRRKRFDNRCNGLGQSKLLHTRFVSLSWTFGNPLGIDGNALGTDGKAAETDGKALGIDGKALEIDGKPLGIDGKALGIDGKAPKAFQRHSKGLCETYERLMKCLWKAYGKRMEGLWRTSERLVGSYDKPMKALWKAHERLMKCL